MQTLLSQEQIDIIDDLGIIEVAVPFPYELTGSPKEIIRFAAKWLRGNYALNWTAHALLVAFEAKEQQIFLKFMSHDILQVILTDSGLGRDLFNEFVKLAEIGEIA